MQDPVSSLRHHVRILTHDCLEGWCEAELHAVNVSNEIAGQLAIAGVDSLQQSPCHWIDVMIWGSSA